MGGCAASGYGQLDVGCPGTGSSSEKWGMFRKGIVLVSPFDLIPDVVEF